MNNGEKEWFLKKLHQLKVIITKKNWFVITQFRKFMTQKQILDGCKKYYITKVIYDFDH